MTTAILAFNGIQLNPINHNNQIWLTSVELAKSLGYAHENAITKIFNRYKDEFTDTMSVILPATQIGSLGESIGLQGERRIFSLRGCHLLAMFSRTAIAKQFRVWVLDVLDKEVGEPKVKTRKLSELTAKERQDLVVNRWVVFVDIYGSQLTNQYNYDIPDVWYDVLGNLSSEDFEHGIEAIKNSGSPYMPKLPVFIAYCKDAEVVTAKDGLTVSEMKEKLGLPCESHEDILKHVEFQDIRIKVCTELLQGMKHSAEIMKGVLKA